MPVFLQRLKGYHNQTVKRQMAENFNKVLIVGAVLFFLVAGGYVNLPGFSVTPPTTTSGTIQTVTTASGAKVCRLEDVTFTPSAVRMAQAGTALPDGHRLFIKGDSGWVDKGIIANLGSTTVSTGQSYRLLSAENSSTYYTVPVGYETYGGVKDVDCQDPYALQTLVPIMTNNGNVGAPTTVFKNSAGTAATAQAIGTGGRETVSLKLTAPADSCMSNPYSKKNLAIACRYNRTEYLEPKFHDATRVGNPSFVTVRYTDDSIVTWDLGTVVCDTSHLTNPENNADIAALKALPREKEWLVDIEARSSSVNPTNSMNCSIIDADFDLNANTLELIDDYEDESGNNLGIQNETTVNLTLT